MNWESLDDKWKNYFKDILFSTAKMSKDPSKKVGALILDLEKKIVIGSGFNGFPRKVLDLDERFQRPIKYDFVIHAEVNAILTSLNNGNDLTGKTIITTFGCCANCTGVCLQVGIKEIVSPPLDYSHGSCGRGYKSALQMLEETGTILTIDKSLEVF